MDALFSNWRIVLVYVITFVEIVAIWFNHHNLFQKIDNIDRITFWLNALWILSLSFLPYKLSWVVEYPYHWQPEFVFISVYIIASIFFTLMTNYLGRINPQLNTPHVKRRISTYVVSLLGTIFLPISGIFFLAIIVLFYSLYPLKP